MKFKYSILLCLFFYLNAESQNVGIGTNNPREKLEVDGAIIVKQAADSVAGTIRFNGTFQGRNFSNWELLSIPRTGLIFTESPQDGRFNGPEFQYFGYTEQRMKTYKVESPGVYEADTWYPVYSSGDFSKQPNPVFRSNTVWRDSVLYVFDIGKMFYYNPTTNTWNNLDISVPNYYYDTGKLFWYNSEFIFITGSEAEPGFRLNPVTSTVTDLPPMGTSYQRKTKFKCELIQGRIIMYGGRNDGSPTNDGMNYNIAANTWTPMNLTNGPPILDDFAVAGMAQELVVWGGTNNYISTDQGYIYNVSSNLWYPMVTTNPPPKARHSHTLTKINGDRVIMVGGAVTNNGTTRDTSDAMIYDYFQGWIPSSAVDFPNHGRMEHTTSLHDGKIYVYGGRTSNTGTIKFRTNGFIYDITNASFVSDISNCNLNSNRRLNAESVCNGKQFFVIRGGNRTAADPLDRERDNSNEQIMYNIENIGEPRPKFIRPKYSTKRLHAFEKL